MKEFYLFNRDLTQAQIERFISENMVPDPLVYYDVRKQNTKNSDKINRGTLIDLSGNGNHGKLNNFQYSSSLGDSGQYYIDDIYPLVSNTDVTIESHKVTVNTDFSGETNGRFIAGSDRDLTDSILQVPAMRLKVSGLVSGEVQIGYVNGSFNNKLTITSDGTYYIPGYEVPKTGENINRRAWSIYSHYNSDNIGVNSGVVIETLPVQRDGWVETYIDDEMTLVLNPTNAGDSTYASHVLMVRNNLNGWVLMANPVVRDTQIKSFRVRVSGLTDGHVSFRTGENQNLMPAITSDGVYTVPAHVEKSGYRPIVIFVSEGASCTIEFLPQTDYIQFDGVTDYINIPSLTEGFKTICMLTEGPDVNVRFYDQRATINQKYFALFSVDGTIAYDALSTGQTYINGELNTSAQPSDLKGDKICIIHRNDGVTSENSSTPYIGVKYTENYNGPIKLSKFLGFREYLSDTQIKKVIEKYGLLEGISNGSKVSVNTDALTFGSEGGSQQIQITSNDSWTIS